MLGKKFYLHLELAPVKQQILMFIFCLHTILLGLISEVSVLAVQRMKLV